MQRWSANHNRREKIFFQDPLMRLRRLDVGEDKRGGVAGTRGAGTPIPEIRRGYYHRNKTEIDAVAGPYKVEVKTTRPRRGYPRGVVTLTKETMPRFLLELAGVTAT